MHIAREYESPGLEYLIVSHLWTEIKQKALVILTAWVNVVKHQWILENYLKLKFRITVDEYLLLKQILINFKYRTSL